MLFGAQPLPDFLSHIAHLIWNPHSGQALRFTRADVMDMSPAEFDHWMDLQPELRQRENEAIKAQRSKK